jgi:hypothetical protein
MKYASNYLHEPPIVHLERRIRRHYEARDLAISYLTFRAHAAKMAELARHGSKTLPERLEAIKPTFFDQHVAKFPSLLSRKERQTARRNRQLLEELERAQLCCEACKLPVPKPLLHLLIDADIHIANFERMLIDHADADLARKRSCVRAGSARHKGFRTLQRLAVRFLRTKAPCTGWKTKKHAAEVLYPHLLKCAIDHELSVSRVKETIEHNVLEQLRKNPRARETFERYRCARRR